MTQQEFMERTGITPTAEDFDYIHAVYLNTSMMENIKSLDPLLYSQLTHQKYIRTK